jgi:hypothetical protein
MRFVATILSKNSRKSRTLDKFDQAGQQAGYPSPKQQKTAKNRD